MTYSTKKYGRLLAASFLCFFVFGCRSAGPSQTLSESYVDSARDQIVSLLMSQQDDWNAGDIESFMSGYVQSDSLRFASGNTIIYGWDDTIDRYYKTYDSREKMGRLAFTLIQVDVLSLDRAIVFGRFHLSRSEDVGDASGLFTLLLKKESDGWLISADHTSAG